MVEALRARRYSRRCKRPASTGFAASSFVTTVRTREMAEMDVNRFLTHLAAGAASAASTQNQVLAAVPFLCDQVLERPPVALTRDGVEATLAQLDGAPRLVCMLLHGSGSRLLEGPGLRVKDLDLDRGEITVGHGKGQKDPVTMLRGALFQPLQHHTGRLHEQDPAASRSGLGPAPLPSAFARTYPNTLREWSRQRVFPASSRYVHGIPGIQHRRHLHDPGFNRRSIMRRLSPAVVRYRGSGAYDTEP